ncbi:MAG: ABC-2 family transporter protein [Actinomycetota bacterium]|nr:ABC-2 family transporter protein [Actinomycetota bacterium]
MPYLVLVRAGWRRWSAYRAATVAGVITNTAFGFIRAAVLMAAINTAGPIGGYDTADAVTYTWLTQGMIMTIGIWRWTELAVRIQSGDIVTDFSRPLDLQGAYLAGDLGRAAYQLLARGVPPFLVGMLAFDLRFPEHTYTWIAFAAGMVLAVVVSFGMRFLVNLGAFWVLDFRGLYAVSSLFLTVASGFAIPLSFFPAWAESLLEVLPWASMVQIPIDVFLEQRTGAALARGLALQVFWVAALLGAGRAVLRVATRRVVVQGG